eukprot:scaffold66643_cov18-Tisochrysis_lutea.AAC.5
MADRGEISRGDPILYLDTLNKQSQQQYKSALICCLFTLKTPNTACICIKHLDLAHKSRSNTHCASLLANNGHYNAQYAARRRPIVPAGASRCFMLSWLMP